MSGAGMGTYGCLCMTVALRRLVGIASMRWVRATDSFGIMCDGVRSASSSLLFGSFLGRCLAGPPALSFEVRVGLHMLGAGSLNVIKTALAATPCHRDRIFRFTAPTRARWKNGLFLDLLVREQRTRPIQLLRTRPNRFRSRNRLPAVTRRSTVVEKTDTRQDGSPHPLPLAPTYPRVHRPRPVHCPDCPRVPHRRHHGRAANPDHQLLLSHNAPAIQPPLVPILAPRATEEKGRVEHHCERFRLFGALRATWVLRGRTCRADGGWLFAGAAQTGLAEGRGRCQGQCGAE